MVLFGVLSMFLGKHRPTKSFIHAFVVFSSSGNAEYKRVFMNHHGEIMWVKIVLLARPFPLMLA